MMMSIKSLMVVPLNAQSIPWAEKEKSNRLVRWTREIQPGNSQSRATWEATVTPRKQTQLCGKNTLCKTQEQNSSISRIASSHSAGVADQL